MLFIAIDDLNDWVGHLGGNPDVKTPHIDRLAERGVSFTNAHCVAPACNPSRAALLSGLRPSTSGIYSNAHDWVNTLADVTTLPQFYRDNGYRVLGGGKIFHALSCGGPGIKRDGDNDPKCWDSYFPSTSRAMPEPVWPRGWPDNQPDLDRQRDYVYGMDSAR